MDYDGDGRLDFLTGSISGKVYLYRRKPNGAFNYPETLKKTTSKRLGLGPALNIGSPSAVAMADWFGSGKLDLFIGNGEGAVYLAPNEGTRQKPVYTAPVQLKAGGKTIVADNGMAGPFVADWDGDGKLDLLVGCASGRVIWYRNIGTKGKPELAAGVTLVEPYKDESSKSAAAEKPKRSAVNAKVCVADWNGDGRPDLIVGDYSLERDGRKMTAHGYVWVYLRQVAGTAAQERKEP